MTAPACLSEFFGIVFKDNTADEASAVWAHLCSLGGSYPQRALACLDAAVADPPADLAEVMEEHGWLILEHDDADHTPYTFDEHVAWLAETARTLREAWEEAPSGTGRTPGGIIGR